MPLERSFCSPDSVFPWRGRRDTIVFARYESGILTRVHMNDFGDDPVGRPYRQTVVNSVDEIASDRLIALFNDWDARRGEPVRPCWRDMELMEIYPIAPFIHVRDIIDGGAEFRTRYWGTALTNNLGFDATGKMLHEYYDGRILDSSYAVYRRVLEYAAPTLHTGNVLWAGHDKEFMTFTSLVLPLDNDDGILSHLLTGLDFG